MLLLNALSLTLNTLALVLTLGVLILGLSRPGPSAAQQAQNRLLAGLALWIAVTITGQLAAVESPPATGVLMLAIVISAAAFGLATVGTYSLLVAAAGRMSGPWQVIARTGVILWLLFQLPLWQGQLLIVSPSGPLGIHITPTGASALYLGLLMVLYHGLTLALAIRWRKRLPSPLILAVFVFQAANLLTALVPLFLDVSLSTWAAGPFAALLGYGYIRREVLGPLWWQVRRVRTLRDLALALAGPSSGDLPVKIARSAAQLAQTDVALLFTVNAALELQVAACIGEDVPIGARAARGRGLAGWVVQRGQPLRVSNYVIWDSGLDGFHHLDLCAALSVPLINAGRVTGALVVADPDSERRFTDEDQALLEVLALQAAVALNSYPAAPPG